MVINWKKELIDQPLHMLMGASVTGLVGWGLSYVSPLWVALLVGALVSRVTWMIREWRQHKDHAHEARYWWSLDLAFIDLGIILSILILIGVL